MAELEVWLADLVRQGLAAAQAQPFSYWSGIAARMVDAQAGGIARLLREAGGIVSSGDGWQSRLLDRLGRLHLLVEAHKRLADLSPSRQADVRALVGWNVTADELAAQPAVADEWSVAGQRTTAEDNLRAQRTWLHGKAGNRWALFLQFAHGSTAFEHALLPNSRFTGELVFHPGSSLRCAIRTRGSTTPGANVPGQSIDQMLASFATALGVYPWLDALPAQLTDVTLTRDAPAGPWSLRDAAGMVVPVAPQFAAPWRVVALGGGRGVDLFGEWDGYVFTPLAVRAGEEVALLAA